MSPQELREIREERVARNRLRAELAAKNPLERALSLPDEVKRAFEDVTGQSMDQVVEATYRRMSARKEIQADAVTGDPE